MTGVKLKYYYCIEILETTKPGCKYWIIGIIYQNFEPCNCMQINELWFI